MLKTAFFFVCCVGLARVVNSMGAMFNIPMFTPLPDSVTWCLDLQDYKSSSGKAAITQEPSVNDQLCGGLVEDVARAYSVGTPQLMEKLRRGGARGDSISLYQHYLDSRKRSDTQSTQENNGERMKCYPAVDGAKSIPNDIETVLNNIVKDTKQEYNVVSELAKLPSKLRVIYRNEYAVRNGIQPSQLPPILATGHIYGAIFHKPEQVLSSVILTSLKNNTYELPLIVLYSFTRTGNQRIDESNRNEGFDDKKLRFFIADNIIKASTYKTDHVQLIHFVLESLKGGRMDHSSGWSSYERAKNITERIMYCIRKKRDFQGDLYKFMQRADVAQVKYFIQNFKANQNSSNAKDFFVTMEQHLPEFARKPIIELSKMLVGPHYTYLAQRLRRHLTSTNGEFMEINTIILGHAECDLGNIQRAYNELPEVVQSGSNLRNDVANYNSSNSIMSGGINKFIYKEIFSQFDGKKIARSS